MHLVHHREVVEALAEVPPSLPDEFIPDLATARGIVDAAVTQGRAWLDPVEVRRLLEAYQIPMAPTSAAADAEQAAGSPPTARELILGITYDPTFGAVIVFGRGGTAVDIINDRALALPPLDLKLARELIERTRVSRLLRGYRDVPAVRLDDVALTLVKLAQLAADIPEVRELEINPLLADETGVSAVDARIVVGRAERMFAGSGNGNFAVRPYPTQWVRSIALKDGGRMAVRPIRPDDEPAIHHLLRRVSMEDLRLRFFAPIKEFSHQFIARLTQLDYARAMAFVAVDERSGEIVGAVRLHSDSIYENGEYAILLRTDMKGRGLGWALMQLLIEYAESEGLKRISGQVLHDNTVMLKMCRDLGFELKTDVAEPEICDVTLALKS
jgi:acetyltransferase